MTILVLLAILDIFLFKILINIVSQLTENKFYSDRLYMLERDREKLVDKLENANRTLYDMANSSKK